MLQDDRKTQEQVVIRHLCELRGHGEEELFALAYRQWYASWPGTAELESILRRYRRFGEIPFWIRKFLRNHPGCRLPDSVRYRRDYPLREASPG